jgi:hypothetical protein
MEKAGRNARGTWLSPILLAIEPQLGGGYFSWPSGLVERGFGAGFVLVAAGRAADADRPDRLITGFGDQCASQQQQVWLL